jgi:hypothetical protein
MGVTPRELDRMTLFEFHAAQRAWIGFHASSGEDEDKPEAMSDERLRELGIVGF